MVFYKDLRSPRVTEVKRKGRTLQALCCRSKNGLGIGFGGKEGEWRSEVLLSALEDYLLLWQTWLPRDFPLDLGVGITGWVGREVGEDDLCDALEMGTEWGRRRNRWSATELKMRLGDWIWRRKGRVEIRGIPAFMTGVICGFPRNVTWSWRLVLRHEWGKKIWRGRAVRSAGGGSREEGKAAPAGLLRSWGCDYWTWRTGERDEYLTCFLGQSSLWSPRDSFCN